MQHAARSAYANFFNYQNLASLTSTISQIVDSRFKQFKSSIDKTTFTPMKIKHHLNSIFSEVVNSKLIGEKVSHQVDGVDLSVAIQNYINNTFSINKKTLNT